MPKKPKKKKKIKAWMIVLAFPDKTIVGPFLTKNRQFEIYLTKKYAKKANEGIDEDIIPCEITFNS